MLAVVGSDQACQYLVGWLELIFGLSIAVESFRAVGFDSFREAPSCPTIDPGTIACVNGTVTHLGLRGIAQLHAAIGEFRSLTRLVAGGNELTQLPSELGQLPRLKQLNVFFNRLDTLPTELGNCKSLVGLFVQENALVSLPTELGKLTRLRDL